VPFDTRTRPGDVGDEPVDNCWRREERHVSQRLSNAADLLAAERIVAGFDEHPADPRREYS
jgi:hypothetical protein